MTTKIKNSATTSKLIKLNEYFYKKTLTQKKGVWHTLIHINIKQNKTSNLNAYFNKRMHKYKLVCNVDSLYFPNKMKKLMVFVLYLYWRILDELVLYHKWHWTRCRSHSRDCRCQRCIQRTEIKNRLNSCPTENKKNKQIRKQQTTGGKTQYWTIRTKQHGPQQNNPTFLITKKGTGHNQQLLIF